MNKSLNVVTALILVFCWFFTVYAYVQKVDFSLLSSIVSLGFGSFLYQIFKTPKNKFYRLSLFLVLAFLVFNRLGINQVDGAGFFQMEMKYVVMLALISAYSWTYVILYFVQLFKGMKSHY